MLVIRTPPLIVHPFSTCKISVNDFIDHCHLRVNDAARRSADGDIIGKHDEFDVENGALPYPTNRDARTVLIIPIQARLRTIRLFVHDDGMHRGRGTAPRVCLGRKRHHGLAHLLWARRGPSCKAHRDGHQMAIQNSHTIARRRYAERLAGAHVERLDAVVAVDEVTEYLEYFPLHFFFFAGDVGNDVVEDVEGGYAGVACARDGLHGGDDARLDRAKRFFEGAEGNDEARRGAVGVCEDETAL